MNFKKDYYKILGVNKDSTVAEIKSAYRKLAKKYHPDLNPGNQEYEEIFKEINEANEILSKSDNRFVYDNYKESETANPPNSTSHKTKNPETEKSNKNRRSYVKKEVYTTEEKIYIKGDIYIKYKGKQDNNATLDILKETIYNITVTDAKAEIISENIYKEADLPEGFIKAFAGKKINLKIKQPIKCTITSSSGKGYYDLEIFNLTIPKVSIENVTKDDGDSYGMLRGLFYGYIKHTIYHEKETVVTECFGETGNVESKTENNGKYYRKEYFKNDCTTYWGNWIQENEPEHIPNVQKSTSSNLGCFSSGMSLLGIIVGVIFLFLLIPSLSFILPYIFIAGLFWLISVKLWTWFFRGLSILLFVLFIFAIISAYNHTNPTITIPKDRSSESTTNKTPIKNSNNDTLITHFRNWTDYNGNSYQGKFSIRKSFFINAKNYKNSFNINSNNKRGYDELLYNLEENDKDNLGGLYRLLDTLKIINKLSAEKFAEMTVSMIQDIPYTVVLPKACDPNLYSDKFISKYLSSENARCDGYEKFGINTPVEFLATLNGDCDTRTLLLYTIFKHYNYDVALLSSEYYNHSIIGINLPYEGIAYNYQNQRYVLWETTAFNKPGILPNEISNIDYWRISLKSK